MKVSITIILSILSISLFAQDNGFPVVKVPAVPSGGFPSLYKWINQNIGYPLQAKEKNVQGKVYIEFIVSDIGEILDGSVNVYKGVEESLDEEAIRLMRGYDVLWIPARAAKSKKKGQDVKQKIILPINFKS